MAGKKEGEGPLAPSFDYIDGDDTFGEATWEKSESAMQKRALGLALDKGGLAVSGLDWLFAAEGAALLDVYIPADENVYPMVPGGKRLDEMVLGGEAQ